MSFIIIQTTKIEFSNQYDRKFIFTFLIRLHI